MDIALTGNVLLIAFLALIGLIVGLIFFLRSKYNAASKTDLTAKYQDTQWDSPLHARTKYPDVDTFQMSKTFGLLGLAVALGIALLGFSWTQYEKEIFIQEDALELDEEIEVEPPRTAEPPPPPPPPPPPVIEEVPEEEIEEEEEIEFQDQSIEEETEIEAPPPPEPKAAPPPPPPPPPPPAASAIPPAAATPPSTHGQIGVSSYELLTLPAIRASVEGID